MFKKKKWDALLTEHTHNTEYTVHQQSQGYHESSEQAQHSMEHCIKSIGGWLLKSSFNDFADNKQWLILNFMYRINWFIINYKTN